MIKYALIFLLTISQAFAGLPPTTTKASGDSTNVTTFNFLFPNFAVTRSGITTTFGILGTAGGGTGVGSVTTSPTASSFSGWDANKNLSANSFIAGYTTTATAAGTTTLAVGSTVQQFFTGTTTQTVVLPVTSTLVAGQSFIITNNSTGVVTVQSSGANTILAMGAGTQAVYTVISTSGTTAASWSSTYVGNGGAITPTITEYTTSSGTYTTPSGVIYLIVTAVGGGGGGGGSASTGSPGTGGTGGATTFGTLTANGGLGGVPNTGTGIGGVGGSASVTTSSVVIKIGTQSGTTGLPGGTSGGNSPGGKGGEAPGFSGAGPGGPPSNFGGTPTGVAAIGNSGGGGGGAGSPDATHGSSGGGGSGGIASAVIIPTAGQTFSYGIGAAGTAGVVGTGTTYAGGAGGSGYVRIIEFYSNGAVGSATNVTGIVAYANGGTNSTNGFNTAIGAYASGKLPTGTIDNTFRVAVFGSVDQDTNSAYNTSTGLYTVPSAGWYHVDCVLEITASVGGIGSLQFAAIQLNSTTLFASSITEASVATTDNMINTSGDVKASASDTIACLSRSTQTTPSYSNGIAGSSFSIHKIGN